METENIVNEIDNLQKALLKRALGFENSEVVEEYQIDDEGQCKLAKRKITKKYVSPDIPAAKILLEHYSTEKNNYQNMSNAELMEERKRLLLLLDEETNNDESEI